MTHVWAPPPVGSIKVNVDASVVESMDYFAIGIVGRDHEGNILFAIAKYLSENFSPHFAELLAVKEGVRMAIQFQESHWIVESDALTVIKSIQSFNPFAQDDPVAQEIQTACSNSVDASIIHCSRKINQVAHLLASRCLQLKCNILFKDAIPIFLKKTVIFDRPF
ncbi:uncharacterized protein [Henckelia pumila]|uniref:uncharacterized protein n=1 Tax=Henckelia pumila TaxID=405737 RepID=UPI003C6DDA17